MYENLKKTQVKEEYVADRQNENADKNSSAPIQVYDVKNVRAAVFEKVVTTKEGNQKKYLNISFGKRYQDKEGKWKTSYSLDPDEIEPAIGILCDVRKFLKGLEDKQPAPPSGAGSFSLPSQEVATVYFAEMNAPEWLETI